jgi:hypothetical protein
MPTLALTLISVVLFCLCAQRLIKSILVPVPVLNQTGYSKSALRVAKGYRIFAWSLMSGMFLVTLVFFFMEVFSAF